MHFIISEFKKMFLDKALIAMFENVLQRINLQPNEWYYEKFSHSLINEKFGVKISMHLFSKLHDRKLRNALNRRKKYIAEHWESRTQKNIFSEVEQQLTDASWPLTVGEIYSPINSISVRTSGKNIQWSEISDNESFLYLGLVNKNDSDAQLHGVAGSLPGASSFRNLLAGLQEKEVDAYRLYRILYKGQELIIDMTPRDLNQLVMKVELTEKESEE